MSILLHFVDTTIRNRRILNWSSRVVHLRSHELRISRLEGEIVDSIAMTQRRRLTRTDMPTLSRTRVYLHQIHSRPFERRLSAKTLDTSLGTSAVSMLLDVYNDVWRPKHEYG